jgi:hypothetical protein
MLIFVPERWHRFRRFETEDEVFDLHDFVNAYCVQKGVPTQFLEQHTLHQQQCRVWWWLSLALYAKAMRTPWVLDSLSSDTAFVGLGFSIIGLEFARRRDSWSVQNGVEFRRLVFQTASNRLFLETDRTVGHVAATLWANVVRLPTLHLALATRSAAGGSEEYRCCKGCQIHLADQRVVRYCDTIATRIATREENARRMKSHVEVRPCQEALLCTDRDDGLAVLYTREL